MTRHATIRVRILVAMFTVLALTAAAVIFTASRVFGQAQERPVAASLDAKAAAVRDAAPGAPDARTLRERLGDQFIQLNVTTVDGRQVGPALPVDLNADDYRYRIVQIDGPGELSQATATLWVSADVFRADRRRLQRDLLLVALMALLASVLVAVVVTNVALRPLEELADRAARIEAGERGIRMGADSTGAPEIGRAAAAIDSMLVELEGSERKAMEAEMDAVEAHTKMKSFLADAAHELKTPLAGIQAAAEALIQLPEYVPPSEREDLEFLLAREANRGGQLVTSLLEAAHVESGIHLRVGPLEVLPLLLSEKHRLSVSRPHLDVQVHGENLVALVDRNGYTSVLRNLIENAATAAGPTGWIRLVAESGEIGDARTPMVCVLVIDSGPGIPEPDRERVFDRLVRLPSTSSSSKGSGLGLAIARGYARTMGGDVRHSNKVPDIPLPGPPGAVFEACLPASVDEG